MTIHVRSLARTDLSQARGLLGESCPWDQAAQVADEKIFGPAPMTLRSEAYGAFVARELVGVAVASARWIRLLAVRPAARGQGIGTALLAAAESAVATTGADCARLLDQPGNYLAPGIDARNQETIEWLERRGYRRCGESCNLVIDVADNPRVTVARATALGEKARRAGYEVRRAAAGDAAVLADAVGRGFSAGWAFEIEQALAWEPPGVHVALRGGEVAAFAAHDGNNRGLGWFGPAGTFPDHRGRGLGGALLLAALLDVARDGHRRCEIAWVGPRGFYDRVAGVCGERTFVAMQKDLEIPS